MRRTRIENDNEILLKSLEGKKPDILLVLLSEYAARNRHINDQIWSIGQVFIPLSLSGVVLGIDDAYRTFGIAIFSIILIWIWYAMTERLRNRMDNAKYIYLAIETKLLKLGSQQLNYGLDNLLPKSLKKGPTNVRQLRFGIALLITIAWLGLTVAAFLIA